MNRIAIQNCINHASNNTQEANERLMSKISALLDSKTISFDELSSCLGLTQESLTQILYNRVCNFTLYQSFVIEELYNSVSSLMQDKQPIPQMRDYNTSVMPRQPQQVNRRKSYSREDIELTQRLMKELSKHPEMMNMIKKSLK